MTAGTRLDRVLPDVLDDLAAGPYPEYIDDVLWTTERTRQRSRWTFPERWLPVDLITQPVRAPGLPWRTIGLVALLLLALVVATAGVYIGTRPHPAQPFGIARTGLVADDTGGDIRVIDPANGTARTLVAGPSDDLVPFFTRDGRGLVFLRHDPSAPGDVFDGDLYWVSVDGGDPVRLTSRRYQAIDWVEASPTSREIAFVSTIDGVARITSVGIDGRGERTYDPSVNPDGKTLGYTPDGASLVFSPSTARSIALLDLATGSVRAIHDFDGETRPFGMTQVSPDGRQVAYAQQDTAGGTIRLHLAGIDGSGDRELRPGDGAHFQAWPMFSPSGRYLLFERTMPLENGATPIIVDLTGAMPDVAIKTSIAGEGAGKEWSPDESFILASHALPDGSNTQQERWDVTTGAVTTAPWSSTAYPSLQRLAP